MYRFSLGSLAILLFLTCCKSGPTNESVVSMLTLKGPSAMGMIYLIDNPDSIIPANLKIEILDEPMLVRARLLKDSPELAVLPLNMAAILFNKNIPYRLIGIPVWGTLYLFGSESGIQGWNDLKGKRIFMMGKATTPDVLFRFLLHQNGLVPDQDVILDYSFPTHIDLANAVSAGRAGLAVISEPLVSLVKARNPAIHQIMDLNAEWARTFPEKPELPQTGLIGHIGFLENHPEWALAIGKAWKESSDSVNLYPELAARRIVFHKILPTEAIARDAIPGCNLKFQFASEIRQEITEYLQVFFTFNPDAVGGKLPNEQFFFQKPDH